VYAPCSRRLVYCYQKVCVQAESQGRNPEPSSFKLLGASAYGGLLSVHDLPLAHHRGRIQFYYIPIGFCGGGFEIEKVLQIKLIPSSRVM